MIRRFESSLRELALERLIICLCFLCISLPSYGSIKLGDKEWRQFSETTGFSYEQVATVCSELTGVCNGSLGDFDFSGWTWATVMEVESLFNLYIPGSNNDLGPSNQDYSVSSAWGVDWIREFFDDFDPTNTSSDSIELFAITRDIGQEGNARLAVARDFFQSGNAEDSPDSFSTNFISPTQTVDSTHGIALFKELVPAREPELTIIVGDREWRQFSDVTGLSWNQIAMICQPNTGSCNGSLYGVDVTGWTWASFQEVHSLIETFSINAGNESLTSTDDDFFPGLIYYDSKNAPWIESLMSWFVPTAEYGSSIGIDSVLRDVSCYDCSPYDVQETLVLDVSIVLEHSPRFTSSMSISEDRPSTGSSSSSGAAFYRIVGESGSNKAEARVFPPPMGENSSESSSLLPRSEATYDSGTGLLKLELVSVPEKLVFGGQYFSLELVLTNSSPAEFTLSSITEVEAPQEVIVTPSFITGRDRLYIPSATVGDDEYYVELKLLEDRDPVAFKLLYFEQIQ